MFVLCSKRIKKSGESVKMQEGMDDASSIF